MQYAPERQAEICRDINRLYTTPAPTIGLIAKERGEAVAELWIDGQLRDLSEFMGSRDKLISTQIAQIAQLLVINWGFLRVTEMMHFFFLVKSGRFGHFYGSMDGITIMSFMNDFMKLRNSYADRARREQERRQKEEEDRRHDQEAITYDEWCRRHGVQ